MSQFLPPQLLALFDAGPPIEYKPITEVDPHERKYRQPLTGFAQYVSQFEDPKDAPPMPVKESRDERRERKRKERDERNQQYLASKITEWTPNSNPDATGDAFKTLFVGRLNYDVTETQLKKEFEEFGPIVSVKMVQDKEGKPRGYAFIEFEHERDMHSAYKRADGRKIDGRRIVVDVERGRTVENWRPRRLGGGIGGTRRGGPDVCTRTSGREDSRKEEDREARAASGERDRKDYDRRDSRRDDRDDRRRDDRDDRRDRSDRGDRDRDRDRGDRSDRDRGDRRDRDRDREDRYRDRDDDGYRGRGGDRDRGERRGRGAPSGNSNYEPLGEQRRF